MLLLIIAILAFNTLAIGIINLFWEDFFEPMMCSLTKVFLLGTLVALGTGFCLLVLN